MLAYHGFGTVKEKVQCNLPSLDYEHFKIILLSHTSFSFHQAIKHVMCHATKVFPRSKELFDVSESHFSLESIP